MEDIVVKLFKVKFSGWSFSAEIWIYRWILDNLRAFRWRRYYHHHHTHTHTQSKKTMHLYVGEKTIFSYHSFVSVRAVAVAYNFRFAKCDRVTKVDRWIGELFAQQKPTATKSHINSFCFFPSSPHPIPLSSNLISAIYHFVECAIGLCVCVSSSHLSSHQFNTTWKCHQWDTACSRQKK